jgi:hypothetical protein
MCQYDDHSTANPSQMQQEMTQWTPTLTFCLSRVLPYISLQRNSRTRWKKKLRELKVVCPSRIHPFPVKEYNFLKNKPTHCITMIKIWYYMGFTNND